MTGEESRREERRGEGGRGREVKAERGTEVEIDKDAMCVCIQAPGGRQWSCISNVPQRTSLNTLKTAVKNKIPGIIFN